MLVSDFYAAYTAYADLHQYCWAHLLRDVDELVARHQEDAGVAGWADGVHALYHRAKTDAAVPDRDLRLRRQQRQRYEAELGILCAPFLGQDTVPQPVLAERITKHLAALFVFVEDPAVPATNNAAERSLRHLVTCRKISGGGALTRRHRHQDDPGHAVWDLAPARAQPPRRVPGAPHPVSNLNSYPEPV